MDDDLEAPSSRLDSEKISASPDGDNNVEQFSDDEDGGPDWTKMPIASSSSARPVIPKRGEKDFEPKAGSNLQLHLLERMRTAMFNALDAKRTISSKVVSYGVWVPSLSRAHVPVARGIHFTSMGYSVPRAVPLASTDSQERSLEDSRRIKMVKRLELLPEEALYLVERGSMFCWKDEENGATLPENIGGTPMTVQQAYSEMIGKGDLTLERYLVYAYLRRLGFVVTRAQAPDEHYPTPTATLPSDHRTDHNRWYSPFTRVLTRIREWINSYFHQPNWLKPIRFSWPFHRYQTYSSIFSTLRLIPSGYTLPLYAAKSVQENTPYKIFYNLYKPNTPFKKMSPPKPDFSIIVVDARTTPIPTLNELSALFDILPESTLPLSRRQKLNSMNKANVPSGKRPQTSNHDNAGQPVSDETILSILTRWVRKLFLKANSETERPPQRPNPFAILKAGRKMIVIAAVDAGMISFFRLGQGEFAEWPMA